MVTSYRRTIDSCVLVKIISRDKAPLNCNYAGVAADLGSGREISRQPRWMLSEHQGLGFQAALWFNLRVEC